MSEKLLTFTTLCEIEAAGADDARKPARFTMTAYTGGAMRAAGWDAPVVVDLAGMAIPSQRRPIRLQHSAREGVGHTETVEVRDGGLFAEGVISRATAAAQDVVESARNGFPWQASIGTSVEKFEFVKTGQSVTVNGQNIDGPCYVVRKSALGEISFVDLGADAKTSVAVAATAAPAVAAGDPPAPGGPAADPGSPPALPATPGASAVTELRASVAEETERIAAVRTLCAGNADIEAKAIREGWGLERTELEVLRASRPQAPAVHTPRDQQTTNRLLQCAVDLSCSLSGAEQRHEAPVLEAAQRRWRGGIGLFELMIEAAHANGYQGTGVRDHLGVMRYAFRPDLCGGFSTVDIGGILSNTANKMLLEGFTMVERTWRTVCAVRPVKDFKTVTSYRMTGNTQYEKVAPSGELKHGDLGEESFTNRAETYGLMLAITRQDVINDDLGAISDVPRRLGRGAALKLNDVFWGVFLNNATFFTAARGNYAEGAATALGIAALTGAEAAFLNMVDADGKPVGANPAMLLVPPALSALSQQLFKGSEIRDNTSNKQYVVTNPHAGKFRVEVSRYLSNASYTGYSAAAWYLLAEPQEIPVIEVAFLNGQESPVVETAEADFNVLGVQMRGYHDFGVALQDWRGGYKAKGEA